MPEFHHPRSRQIERVASPPSTAEFERRFVRPGRPAIFTGVTTSWPALERWKLDALRARFGDRAVPVARVARGRLVGDAERGIPFEEMPLARFLDGVEAQPPAPAYAMMLANQWIPELVDDLGLPAFAPRAGWSTWKVWISPDDTRTPLHQDLPDNFFAQIVGRKHIVLYPPRAELSMYRHAPWSKFPQVSRVDAFEPDFERFRWFTRAAPIHAIVEPGDVLYLPRFWWHQVRSIGTSVSANFWWTSGLRTALARGALAYQSLRKLRY